MSPARIIVLVIALVAGVGAAILAGGSRQPAARPEASAPAIKTGEVLVAARDIPMGATVAADNVRWQAWPEEAISPQFVARASDPNAVTEYAGAIARTAFVQGEPLRPEKLIKSGSGFMSAILSAGMRAASTEISEETGAGGFILPNDRVDVLLARKTETSGGVQRFESETILRNIRVLAIDQTVEDEKGEKIVVPKKTATLEVTPKQAETLALAKELGTISLVLRPLVDANAPVGPDADLGPRSTGGGVTIVRFGVPQQAAR